MIPSAAGRVRAALSSSVFRKIVFFPHGVDAENKHKVGFRMSHREHPKIV
jgi:hypothetical protein